LEGKLGATGFSRSFAVGFGGCAAWANAYKARRSEERELRYSLRQPAK
jgi:hypothetical protein